MFDSLKSGHHVEACGLRFIQRGEMGMALLKREILARTGKLNTVCNASPLFGIIEELAHTTSNVENAHIFLARQEKQNYLGR
jgi:hypothetical protein